MKINYQITIFGILGFLGINVLNTHLNVDNGAISNDSFTFDYRDSENTD